MVAGDYNTTTEASGSLFEGLVRMGWQDACQWGQGGPDKTPTSKGGTANRIDMVWMNRKLNQYMQTYRTAIGFTPRNHKQLLLAFDPAIQSQWTYVPRRMGKHGPYASQTHLGEVKWNQAATELPAFLAQGQLDKAYKAWCREAEKITELLSMDSGEREAEKDVEGSGYLRHMKSPKLPKP